MKYWWSEKMEHTERLNLAKDVGKRIIQKYGKDNVLSVGIYGSVARNEDNEFSDLEMIVITKKKDFMKHYIYKDTTVTIIGTSFKNAIKMIRKIDEQWSLRPGYLIHQKIIFGDKKIINKFKKEVESVKENDLKKAAENQISWMYENLNKIKTANKVKSRGKMLFTLTFYTIQANLFVGLLNKYVYIRQGFDALKEAKKLKKLPQNYYKLMMILYENTDLEEITKAASELFNNCQELLK
jgi:predicted nucleotidyltransferase